MLPAVALTCATARGERELTASCSIPLTPPVIFYLLGEESVLSYAVDVTMILLLFIPIGYYGAKRLRATRAEATLKPAATLPSPKATRDPYPSPKASDTGFTHGPVRL